MPNNTADSSDFYGQYIAWMYRHRILVVVITIIITLLFAAGFSKLQFSTDYKIWFSADDPRLQAYEDLQSTYSRTDNLMILLQPKEGDVFNTNTLSAVAEITERAWKFPYSSRVDSLTNYQHTRAEGDSLYVEDLAEHPEKLSKDDFVKIKEIALSEPTLVKRIVSVDARTTGINITLQFPLNGEKGSFEVMQFARSLVEEIKPRYPDHHFALTGVVPLDNAFYEASANDMATLTPIMYFVIVLVTFGLLRSVGATIIVLLVVSLSTMIGMGAAGWLGIPLTPASAIAPTVILTLAVADSIHMLMHYLKLVSAGSDRVHAMQETMRLNSKAVFLTSVTTVIGFLSMNASDAPPFHDLGNISAIGVTAAYLISITFLPALGMLMTLKPQKFIHVNSDKWMNSFADFVIRHSTIMLVGTTLITAVSAIYITKIELDDRFVEYFDDSIQFRRDADFASDALAGLYQIDFSLGAPEGKSISDPKFLQTLEKFSTWLRAQEEVDHVLGIADTFKRLNKNLHGDDPDYYTLPESDDLAAQYLLLYEFSLPYGLDLNDQIDIAKTHTRVSVTLKNLSSREMREFNARAEQWLHQHGIEGVSGVGPSIMFAYVSERNIEGMVYGSIASLIIISAILIFVLGDWKVGLISMIPNLLPCVLAFGLWGATVGRIDMGVSVVISICLGIIVDDTVHFLTKYLRAIKELGMEGIDAVHYAFSSVGMALLVTSVIIVSGFLILSLSDFNLNHQMGMMNAMVIGIALIADFLMLAPLLILISKKRKKRGVYA